MYMQYYGLRELPFELTTDPKYLCLTAQHREALSTLQYGLSSAKALIVLIAEAGMGKTTVLRAALQSEAVSTVRAVHLSNPTLSRADFTRTLAGEFGLSARAAESKAVLLSELEDVLRDRRARGDSTALVVDEAQSLSRMLFEEIRLLANIETPTEKLLPVVLAGQPELSERLEDPALRQLKQRVALRCEIRPLAGDETARYIASRIKTAGGDAFRLFTREAVAAIHEHSRGIPRVINVICDNALVNGMALRRQPVDRELVMDVCRDFALGGARVQAPSDEPSQQQPSPLADAAPAEHVPQASTADGDVDAGVAPAQHRFLRFRKGQS